MKDKLIPSSKFPFVLGFSALLIALCAAFFSVYGISTLFAGASISAMIMASSLEIGKLVGTTFLYRYWKKCTGLLKSYLVVAILILMVITSLGIFGYLSSAYQQSSIEYGVTQDKIVAMENQKKFYYDKVEASKKRINDLTTLRSSQELRMNEVLTNEFIARNPIQLKQLQQQNIDMVNDTDTSIKSENDKIQNSIDEVSKIDSQINDLKLGTASKKDVQTFRFVADALHVSLDTVARWFILGIIFVFDPLAVCLILAYNVAVYKKEESVVDVPSTNLPVSIDPPKVENVPLQSSTPVQETPKIENVSPTPVSADPNIKKHNMDDFFKRMFKLD